MLALVGPPPGSPAELTRHTAAVATSLREAGHSVTLVGWAGGDSGAAGRLAAHRPDSWVRTGRELRDHDAVVVMHAAASAVPVHLALLSGLTTRRGGRPRVIALCDGLPATSSGAAARLAGALLSRLDGIVVHTAAHARVALELGAPRVYELERPTATDLLESRADVSDDVSDEVSPVWASYVGAIEALTAPPGLAAPTGGQREPGSERQPRPRRTRVRAAQPRLALERKDLPDWVLPSDVLADAADADDARAEARRLGLPRVRGPIEAWAALGALAAILRLADNGTRRAVLVDESGSGSPLGRWASAVGFAPLDLRLTAVGDALQAGPDDLGTDGPDDAAWRGPEVDAGAVDVVARVHPGGCDAADLLETLAAASWALRPGGLLVLTLPLSGPGVPLAFAPADVRAAVATAHDHGFVLVGDLDGELGMALREAAGPTVAGGAGSTGRPAGAARPGPAALAAGMARRGAVRQLRSAARGGAPARPGEPAAYGLVRLTLRRR